MQKNELMHGHLGHFFLETSTSEQKTLKFPKSFGRPRAMSQLSADSVPDAADVGTGTAGRSVNAPPTAVPTAPVPMLIPEYPAAEAALKLGIWNGEDGC